MNRFFLTYAAAVCLAAGGQVKAQPAALSMEDVIEKTCVPFSGPTNPQTDVSTLTGKVMAGYQGWFTTPTDGSGRGWFHWSKKHREFEPRIDLWPDMSEYPAQVQTPTGLKHADGSDACLYSSMYPQVTDLHFKWMRDYNIDGVFVQRFAAQTFTPAALNHVNTVLNNCRAAANKYGRAYALMYDLSGIQGGQIDRVIDDVKRLTDRMRLFDNPADKSYLHHNGKPLIAVWGVGFNDNRRYDLDDCKRLIDFLKTDPTYGRFTVMLGIPTWWRQQYSDTVTDPNLHEVLQAADILSPWSVGRFNSPQQVSEVTTPLWEADVAWCRERNLQYMPVLYAGFSWANMTAGPLNQVPRLKGQFFWSQVSAAKKAGAEMLYVAMFDEVDEGTAIYKCTNTPPEGPAKFVTYEGLPSDFYLRLAGAAGKVIRDELPLSEAVPLFQ